MKNHAYCAVFPILTGIQKIAAKQTAQPKYPYSIQGRALPILDFVLSIIVPKKISLIPSNTLETAINVPTIPEFNPMISVRKTITNAESSAYTTLPAMSPEPYPTLLYHFKYLFSS